jgi:hypothetical protein
MRTAPLAVAGWAVAATLTLGASWSAVQVVRSAVAPDDLATSSTDSLPPPAEGPSGTTSGTASPTGPGPRPSASATTPAGRLASASGVGGTVVVRCVDGTPQFVSRIPRQGFSVDVDDSPGEVKFSSADHRTEITASCPGGQPRISVEEDDRRGGGDGDNSGPGGGNSGPGGGDDD